MERDRQRTLAHIEAHSFTVQTYSDEALQNETEQEREARLDREMLLAEEAFLAEFDSHLSREMQRRQAASTAEINPPPTSTSAAGKRRFGEVVSLGRDSFVEFIDSELPTTVVVIHLYQNTHRSCVRLREVLHDMARTYPTVKFGEMLSAHAAISFDDLALPVILVYKAGELMESFVKITEDIGFNFDFDDLEQFLVECVCLCAALPILSL